MRSPHLSFITMTCSINLLMGCVSTSPPEFTSPVTPSFHHITPASAPHDTVTQTMLDSETMSLDTLFAYADRHAPALLTARARAQMSQADVVAADFTFPENPSLNVAAGVRVNSAAFGFDYEASLSQTFEVAGEQHARRDVARAGVALAQSQVDELAWLTHVEVHRLARLWLVTQEQRTYAQVVVTFASSITDITQAQIDAGEISPLELLVVQTDLARAKAQLIEIDQHEEVIKTRLAAIIGWPSTRELPELSEPLPATLTPRPTEELLELLATHHPSVTQRELAVDTQRARLALAHKEASIKPSFGISLARESSPGSSGSGPSQSAHIGMLTLGLPLNVWRRNQDEIVRAQASITLAERERVQTLIELERDLCVASTSVEAAITLLDLYATDIIPQLKTHLALLERAYELGEVDIHQVSQTRERLLDAMTQYIQARVLYFERAATLEGLVGTEQWGTPTSTQDTP